MCYYSQTLHPSAYRDAKAGENLTLHMDRHGHHHPRGEDGKVVCIREATEVHIEKFQLDRNQSVLLQEQPLLKTLIGKPVSAHFHDRGSENALDRLIIMIDGRVHYVHFAYLAVGMRFYTGPKRADVSDTLGVNDPSIALDHKGIDEMPTLDRAEARATVSSIRR